MLKTNYNDNVYIFYLTLKDAEQYNAFGRFPVPIVGDRYLFKFTNDMSGAVKYAYSKVIVLNDRYAKVEIYNTVLQSENIYEGRVNFEETGYWKYEVFWMYAAIKSGAASDCDLFNPLERGTWECTNSSGTVIDSGNLDVDTYEITGLVADTYTIKEYSTCKPPPFTQPSTYVNTLTQVIGYEDCASSGLKELFFKNVVRKSDSTVFYIESNASVGQEIRFVGNFWAGRTYSYIVKTKPEDIVIEVSAIESNMNAPLNPTDAESYQVLLYDGTTLLRDYTDDGTAGGSSFVAVKKPIKRRKPAIIAWNNEWEVACSFGTPLGSIFFTWNGTGNSPNGGYITELEAPIEIGKLLIEEPLGDEKVKYTQHESPNDTNYIYND